MTQYLNLNCYKFMFGVRMAMTQKLIKNEVAADAEKESWRGSVGECSTGNRLRTGISCEMKLELGLSSRGN